MGKTRLWGTAGEARTEWLSDRIKWQTLCWSCPALHCEEWKLQRWLPLLHLCMNADTHDLSPKETEAHLCSYNLKEVNQLAVCGKEPRPHKSCDSQSLGLHFLTWVLILSSWGGGWCVRTVNVCYPAFLVLHRRRSRGRPA